MFYLDEIKYDLFVKNQHNKVCIFFIIKFEGTLLTAKQKKKLKELVDATIYNILKRYVKFSPSEDVAIERVQVNLKSILGGVPANKINYFLEMNFKVDDPKIIELVEFLLRLKADSKEVLKKYAEFFPNQNNKSPHFTKEIHRFINNTIESNIKELSQKRKEIIITRWKNTLNSESLDLIQKIEKTIARLDSFWVYGGRRKAAQIRTALNHVYDAIARGDKPENMHELLNYKQQVKNLNSIFITQALSLHEALSLHRFPELDKFLDIKTPKSKFR